MGHTMITHKQMTAIAKRKPRSRVRLAIATIAIAFIASCASPEERVEKFAKSGMEYLEQGDLGRANVQFQNALKINEEHVPALIGMAKIAEEKQDLKNMFGLLQRIVRLDPNQVESLVNLGKLYLIGSDETEALEYADKALALEPGNAGALTLKAAVQLKLGDNTGAVELANRVKEREPSNPEAVTVLATERILAGDNEAALAELDAALAIKPEIAVLQLLRIQVLTNLGRTDDVRGAYFDLVELFPEETVYRRVYTNILLNRGDYDGALEQLEAIAELEPENVEAKIDVIRALYTNKDNGPAAAEEKLRGYVDAEPNNAELKFAYVDFLQRENKNDEANALLEALSGSEESEIASKAKNEIAEVFLQNGERDKAAEVVNEILEADERNTDALIKRATLRIEAEEYDAAIVDLRTALDNDPDSANAMVVMATAFERQGSISFARAELARAFEASQRDPKISNIYAKFLMRHDELARAEEVLVNSLAVKPGNADNLKLLAGIRLSLQDWRGAEEIAQILENISDNDDIAGDIRSAAYTGLGEFDRVIESLTARNDKAPLESRPLATLVAAYVRSNRLDEAEELLNRIIGSETENYAARILLAQVHGIRQNNEQAEAVLIEAAENDPSRPEAYELLYRYYLRAGDEAKATALIEEGLSKAPENIALRVFKADVLLSSGRMEEAFNIYAELIEVRPQDRLIANNFVSLSSDLRSDGESIARALEVAKVLENEDNPLFADTVGWAYYRAGRHSEAVDYLTRAAEAAGGNAEILYHLGAAQLAAGDSEQAKINLENALSASGSNFRFEPEVRDLLGRL